jgi:hypothetical protein
VNSLLERFVLAVLGVLMAELAIFLPFIFVSIIVDDFRGIAASWRSARPANKTGAVPTNKEADKNSTGD